MSSRRVVITGLGIINALALDKDQYFQALLSGEIGIERIKSFKPDGFPSQVAGEAPEFKIAKIVPKAQRKATKLMSRDIELAVAAADTAIRDAGLKTRGTNPDGPVEINPTRSGVHIGAGLICCDLSELAAAAEYAVEDGTFSLPKWGNEGMNWLTPLWLLKYLPNMLSCHISIIHDLQGPSNSITCGEASGMLSITEAYLTILHDKADVIIAGGAESKVNGMGILRQCLINRASTHYNDKPKQASRPFDRDADGMVIGEGAGIVILEEMDNAQQRGAEIYAELTGWGASYNFSKDFVEPEESAQGIILAVQQALERAAITPDQIDLIIPAGIAVPSHDSAEARALNAVFGEHLKNIPILATKSRFGHCGAGAGAIDLVTAVLSLYNEIIPPNVNCSNQPAEYGMYLPHTEPLEKEIKHVMCCCDTTGGQTAALVISKFKE